MAKRTYTLNDLVVNWDDEKCIHCEDCRNALPHTFDPARRPWVKLDAGDAPDAIREVVRACPSQAISLGE
jgi:uncharacterized Fe-S cluster protein YjdI